MNGLNGKISELVTQFVDELFKDDDMSDQENIEAKNDAFVMCMAFAGHILETHCIVEKGEIKSLNKEVTNTYLAGSHISYDGWMNILKRFFGEDYQNILKQ